MHSVLCWSQLIKIHVWSFLICGFLVVRVFKILFYSSVICPAFSEISHCLNVNVLIILIIIRNFFALQFIILNQTAPFPLFSYSLLVLCFFRLSTLHELLLSHWFDLLADLFMISIRVILWILLSSTDWYIIFHNFIKDLHHSFSSYNMAMPFPFFSFSRRFLGNIDSMSYVWLR
jgi:hypothetical protein